LKLLLDTHAALWFLSGDDRMSENARPHLTDDSNRVLLSAAVVWEIAIKRSLGKLVVPDEYLSLLLGRGRPPARGERRARVRGRTSPAPPSRPV